MLSEKLTLSLTCLVLIFGLAIYVPTAMADHGQFDMSLSAAENMIDVSSDDGMQIATGRDRASRAVTEGTSTFITLLLKSNEIVQLGAPATATELGILVGENGDLQTTDIQIDAYDREGRALGVVAVADVGDIVTISHRDASNPGKEFLVRIDETELALAYANAGGPYEIHTLLFTIPKEKVERADRGYILNKRDSDGHAVHTNNHVNTLQINLVDDDEGMAVYNTGLGIERADSGVPGVVAIQSLRERRGFIETGDFTVRVILTEEPMGGFKTDHVAVKNGSATAVAKGTVLKGGLAEIAADLTATPPVIGQEQRDGDLTPAMISYYSHPAAAGTAATMVAANTAAGTDGTYGDDFPEPTGRDNQFHQYFVTIKPNAGLSNADVTISIKAFDDKVIPVPNRYVPLSDAQIAATTLSDPQTVVRNSRVMNETLTVIVSTAGDTTSKVGVAKGEYDTRQKYFEAATVVNEAILPNKTYIPAGGFLVIHAADLGDTGITNPQVTTKAKVTAASKLYNTVKLGLPFPADDLENFFRNGGTLTLAYADIPEATGSGHDDSKGPTGDDATGYTAATTNAYTKGALIFNEIMWGLDAGGKNSQYIELHNPGTAAIGIDNKEWIITVGPVTSATVDHAIKKDADNKAVKVTPTFTVIDTVSNVPGGAYWPVPGQSGVTAVSDTHPVVLDLISMSRVEGTMDGTAAASWAESIHSRDADTNDKVNTRGFANLSGRRIGTPGAANNYVVPAPTPTTMPDPEPEPMAPAAEADDIMISEIMVASNGGALPQWIELANGSGAAVSLDGWMLEIENDSADDDVVAADIEIDLSGITIGADQVALIVSKEGRNSGVSDRMPGDDNEGDFDSKRILDVQAQVSPDNARYSLISEMGFMLTLMPPRMAGSAIRPSGDSAGNLGGGWDLPPMSEGGRSSLIRSDEDADMMGTDAADWVLASSTSLDGAYRTTYYGDDEDMGTPGYDAGGALPVELSAFGAKRNDAGQVVITWETQSELNNAGFFVKRSQQRNGKFVVINAVMVQGAGTTAEKQSYTYTDHSAQPNVVYYYQIEDVSLDGNRQTLTRAHRLKGHIGAAGKLTTIWGELKSQE